mgnify:CR=1 FL=1
MGEMNEQAHRLLLEQRKTLSLPLSDPKGVVEAQKC